MFVDPRTIFFNLGCYSAMKSLFAFLVILLLAYTTDVKSQSRKKKRSGERPAAGYTTAPSALAPGTSTETAAPRQSKKKTSRKTTYDQQQEYYERVAAVAKTREKTARIMEKPQYSDPTYFGHKRKPKRRPPHKMRLCKECGIRH